MNDADIEGEVDMRTLVKAFIAIAILTLISLWCTDLVSGKTTLTRDASKNVEWIDIHPSN